MDREVLEERMRDLDSFVVRTAHRIAECTRLEAEDVAQDLRIELMTIAAKYDDGLGVPWRPWAFKKIKYAAIDYLRKNGPRSRHGKQRPTVRNFHRSAQHGNTEQSSDFEAEAIECPAGGQFMQDIEWDDLVAATEESSLAIRSAVLYASGMRMKDIGAHVGVSESRISQACKNAPQFSGRLGVLMGVEARSAPCILPPRIKDRQVFKFSTKVKEWSFDATAEMKPETEAAFRELVQAGAQSLQRLSALMEEATPHIGAIVRASVN